MLVRYRDHYLSALESTIASVRRLLERQILETDSADFGGVIDPVDELVHPGSATGALLHFTELYVNADSPFHLDGTILERMKLLVEYSLRVQHPDGTFDLLTTNFHSSPDNGFIMLNLAGSYRLFELLGDDHGSDEFKGKLLDLIARTADGMVGGGFHTPNHRWVIASGLEMAHSITGDSSYRQEAERYLAEGIDIDEEGEYTERSSGIYNAVNDRAMIILSDERNDASFLDPVERNLGLVFTYLDPDGSLFTWNSTRQDKSEGGAGGRFYPSSYYDIYLAMITRRDDPRYSWMAEQIRRRFGPGGIARFMLDGGLVDAEREATTPEPVADRFSPRSGIVRMLRGWRVTTLLAKSSSFLFFQVGDLRLRMKMCASFFGKGQFIPSAVVKDGNDYMLEFEEEGDYRLPLEPPPGTSDWHEMDHSRRRHVRNQRLELSASIHEIDGGVEVTIRSHGCERVPFKLELIVPANATVVGESFGLTGRAGGSITVRSGNVLIRQGADAVSVGPAFGLHRYTDDMRGSEPRAADSFTLYFSDHTPVERTIRLEAASGSGAHDPSL